MTFIPYFVSFVHYINKRRLVKGTASEGL